jgi:hypothetical protein
MSLEDILDLERQVWEAAARGDASADARLLHDSFLGVYATGFAGRSEHVAQLDAGPVISRFELHDARLVVSTQDLALLAYRAVFRRPGSRADAPEQCMYVSSLWKRFPEGWRNIFSQDT